jgi:hypothetical protein
MFNVCIGTPSNPLHSGHALSTVRPDRANFHPLGDCFLWVVFLKMPVGAKVFGKIFPL